MYCTNCGKPLAENARFCGGCGTAAASEAPAPPPAPLIPAVPADAAQSQWYYVYQGKAYGPETQEGMYRLMRSGILRNDTYVWRKGMDDWVRGDATELNFRGARKETQDPVLDVFSWLLAFLPLILGLLEMLLAVNTGWAYWWISFVLNSALVLFDRQRMRQIGLEPSSFIWWLFLIPVYIWKRSTFLRISHLYFWLWWASFFASLIFF